jgi:hypothetical protein
MDEWQVQRFELADTISWEKCNFDVAEKQVLFEWAQH